MLGGFEINKVQKLKYLGVGLNSRGARAHDKAKEAEATQSTFKLRTTRAKLGEVEKCCCYAPHSMYYLV